VIILQADENVQRLRIRVVAGHNLAKKDIFGARYVIPPTKLNKYNFSLLTLTFCSDPYVRVDLNTIEGDETIDSVMTRTKKRVGHLPERKCWDLYLKYEKNISDPGTSLERRVHI
jgi:hypothetical protein